MSSEPQFIIRVYGLIINDQNEILVSDEYVLDTRMTKFPGGGLEFGEGPVDCLKRESMEEMGQTVEIISHFYTTDYFQKALFYENAQLISIYYLARFVEEIHFKISSKAYDFPEKVNGSQSFRWVPVKFLDPGELTFPIDRKVAEMLKSNLS